MRSIIANLSLFLMLIAGMSASAPSIDFRAGRFNNVCKDLNSDVLLYFVFVDTRTTYPWTEFDILTTIDSIQVASRWLEEEAANRYISLTINTLTNDDVEFSVVSYTYPSEIAHSFLHLYGAVDLYETPFRRSKRKIKQAILAFPDDIMSDVYARPLNGLEIGEYTRYMIGWTEELDPEYEPLLTERHSILK